MSRAAPLDAAGHRLVSDAVALAEKDTDGEIVTIVADRTSDYWDIAWALSGLVALMALATYVAMPALYVGIADRLSGGWLVHDDPGRYLWLVFVLVSAKFWGTFLLLLWRPLRLWLVPRGIRRDRVRNRAILLFKVGAERRTMGRTGILVYVSLAEHRAEIVADEGIARTVAPELWGEAMVAMLAQIREGRTAEGLAAAVERIGAILHAHVPATGTNPNELPDRLIEL